MSNFNLSYSAIIRLGFTFDTWPCYWHGVMLNNVYVNMFTLATSAVFRLTGNWPKFWDSTSCTRMTVLVFVLFIYLFLEIALGVCVCLKITQTAAWMASGSLFSRAVKKTIWDCVCVKQSATFSSSSSSLFLSLSSSHTGAWHHVEGWGGGPNVESKCGPHW